VTLPTQPSVAGRLEGTVANRVAVEGDYAYLAGSEATLEEPGLVIVDVSDPAQPTQVGFLSYSPGELTDLVVRADLVYAVGFQFHAEAMGIAETGTFQIVDVSNPSAPVARGQVNVPATAAGIALLVDRAFVAAGDLRVINVADPDNPQVEGFLEIAQNTTRPRVVSDAVYMLTDAAGVVVVGREGGGDLIVTEPGPVVGTVYMPWISKTRG